MMILSLDCARSICAVSLWRDGQTLASAEETMERGQDQRLMPLILEIMKGAQVSFDSLDRIAVTRGPGSFTGLRIALAAARGIGLAATKPVIGIDRFSIFREQVPTPNQNLFVIINSKRKELFCQSYPLTGPLPAPQMMTSDDIHAFLKSAPRTVVTGDCSEFNTLPTQKETETCAQLAAKADPLDPFFHPSPLYLRAPDVTFAKK